jgi:hypothetical protein
MASNVPPLLLECVAYSVGSRPAATMRSLQHPQMVDMATFSEETALITPPDFEIRQAKKDFGSPREIPMTVTKSAKKTPTQFVRFFVDGYPKRETLRMIL